MESDLTLVYVLVPIVVVILLIIFIRLFLQYRWGHCKSSESLKGKTYLLTGANSGIGFETGKALAERGARVIFACRNFDSANEAIAAIRKTRKKPFGEMIAMQVDLSSMESIRSFVDTVKVGFTKIDVLINNAGVSVPTKKGEKTKDGFEINFGVNHLAPFLLTNMLLDRLEAAAPSRVVIVSSQLYKDGVVDFEDLNLVRKCEELQKNKRSREDPAYSNSKLMNIYFGKALAERTKERGIDVFILCPGFTYTNLFRHNLRWYHYIFLGPIFFFSMRTAKQGAQTTLHCATEPSIQGKSGTFYANCKAVELQMKYSKDTEQRLWTASEDCISSQMA